MFKCPRCRNDSISVMNKYKAGLWLTITCPRCETRLCAYPWLLMGLHLVYLWNILWFIGLFLAEGNPVYLLYMVAGLVLLEIANVKFIPLAAMRRKPSRSA